MTNPTVALETNHGRIVLELDAGKAPGRQAMTQAENDASIRALLNADGFEPAGAAHFDELRKLVEGAREVAS